MVFPRFQEAGLAFSIAYVANNPVFLIAPTEVPTNVTLSTAKGLSPRAANVTLSRREGSLALCWEMLRCGSA